MKQRFVGFGVDRLVANGAQVADEVDLSSLRDERLI
jgi:hypothetical protein